MGMFFSGRTRQQRVLAGITAREAEKLVRIFFSSSPAPLPFFPAQMDPWSDGEKLRNSAHVFVAKERRNLPPFVHFCGRCSSAGSGGRRAGGRAGGEALGRLRKPINQGLNSFASEKLNQAKIFPLFYAISGQVSAPSINIPGTFSSFWFFPPPPLLFSQFSLFVQIVLLILSWAQIRGELWGFFFPCWLNRRSARRSL